MKNVKNIIEVRVETLYGGGRGGGANVKTRKGIQWNKY